MRRCNANSLFCILPLIREGRRQLTVHVYVRHRTELAPDSAYLKDDVENPIW
jgi:hypothetical protein